MYIDKTDALVGIPVSIKRLRIESEPSRERFTPSRSIYIVGSYGSGGVWHKMSQSTRSPTCFLVLIISVLMSLIPMTGSDKRADHLLDTKLKIVSF